MYLLLRDVFPLEATATTSRRRITATITKKEKVGLVSPNYFKNYQWIAIAALCIAIRPSSALFWGSISLWYLTSWCPVKQRRNKAIVGISIGLFVQFATELWDRVWYKQRWVLVPWNFFVFNLLQGGSELYGAHPWHWNLSCGVPTVLTTLLPLVLIGLYRERESSSQG